MISDGHNLMLDSREEYRLYLILKDLYEMPWKFDDCESDQITYKWIMQLFDTMEEARLHPYEKQTI